MVRNRNPLRQIRPYNDQAMAGRPPSKEAPPFGRKLAALRKERGWSQEQFAKQLGISRKMVDYYERRAQNPSVDFVKQAAEILDVQAAVLIDELDDNKKRKKPGPQSRLEQRIEEIRKLPRKDQEFVLRMLDTVLDQAKAS